MKKFRYRAKDKDGGDRSGLVEANNIKQAAKILREKGLWVITIKPQTPGVLAEVKGSFFKHVSFDDKVNFTRQLSTMINAGLPITDALNLLETQSSPAMASVVGDILRRVESGNSLTSALQKHPRVFEPIILP